MKKYKNKKWLEEKCEDPETTIGDIAKECGVSESTIHNWKNKFGLESKRDKTKSNNPNWDGGKEKYNCNQCGETIKRNDSQVLDKIFCSTDCQHKWRKENMTGEDHPKYEGLKTKCAHCDKEFEINRYELENSDKNFCSRECQGEYISENLIEENHPRWKGNWEEKNKYAYYGPNWEQKREEVIKRDNESCQKCGLKRPVSYEKYESDLEVHHIKPARSFIENGEFKRGQANKKENLVTLCKSCHSKTHGEHQKQQEKVVIKQA